MIFDSTSERTYMYSLRPPSDIFVFLWAKKRDLSITNTLRFEVNFPWVITFCIRDSRFIDPRSSIINSIQTVNLHLVCTVWQGQTSGQARWLAYIVWRRERNLLQWWRCLPHCKQMDCMNQDNDKMKLRYAQCCGKAAGPSGIITEMLKAAG